MAQASFDDAMLRLLCPTCGYEARKSLGWLKSNAEFACVGCGNSVPLDNEEFRTGLNRAETAVAELRYRMSRTRMQ